MVGRSPKTRDSTKLLQIVKEFIFKLPSLIVKYFCWETKSKHKFIVLALSCSCAWFILSCIGLSESGEMVDND